MRREFAFPLKHVLAFKWFFREAKTLKELSERLKNYHFYVASPKSNILVTTSEARPYLVLFTFIKNRPDGGDLILVQAPWGWYSLTQILKYVRMFAKRVGIFVKLEHQPFKQADNP